MHTKYEIKSATKQTVKSVIDAYQLRIYRHNKISGVIRHLNSR